MLSGIMYFHYAFKWMKNIKPVTNWEESGQTLSRRSLDLITFVVMKIANYKLWSKFRYKCFEAFDRSIRRKNFTN